MVSEQTRYSRLANITKVMNTKLELHEVLTHVITAISEEIVQCDAVGIFLPQEDGTFRGFGGKPEKINGITLDMLVVDPEKDKLVKELVRTRKTIYIPDTSEDDRPDPGQVNAFKIKSLLALPISLEQELFGLIFLFDYGAAMNLTDLEIQSVEAYVNMAAVSIQNAKILKQKEALLTEKQLMLGVARELSKCSSARESLDICFAYLERILGKKNQYAACLFDPIDKNSIKLTISNSKANEWPIHFSDRMNLNCSDLIQEVAKTKKMIYIQGVFKDNRVDSDICRQLGIKNLLMVPFVSMGEVLGAIVIGIVKEEKRSYPDCLIQLAQSIADATAPVYSNWQYVNHLECMVEERTKELAAANEKVISVIEGLTGGFFALDKKWNFTYINQHQILPQGKKADVLLGGNLWETYPELKDTIFYDRLHQVMDERIPVQFESRSAYGDIWHEVTAYPYEEGICCLFKDITEKKKYEKEIKRLSSLDLIGQTAAGISHEIRNPMTTVRGFLQLLKMENELGKHHGYFDLMIEELDRANSIITEFLSMGNMKTCDMEMLNLNTIIYGMIPLIEIDAMNQNKRIEVETGDLPDLRLNHNEIRQLIVNLYRNGLEAMDKGEVLSIRTYRDEDSVILAVKDSGKGIDPDILDKLGTPFFTTKDNGTGLGLGVCYGIAARHKAEIEIMTGAEGTTFFVKFKI